MDKNIIALNNIKDIKGSKKKAKRVGRGMSSGTGKTSGKGAKGQKARSGVAIKAFEGGQTPLIKRLPKRGFNPINRVKVTMVNLSQIDLLINANKIKEGDVIDSDKLRELGILKGKSKSKLKLLAKGSIKKKLQFKFDSYSKGAKALLEKIGCTIL